MIKLIDLLKEAEAEGPKCPVATQDAEVNVKHRQLAIEHSNYGPKNPNNPNVKFWKGKAQLMGLEALESAKASRCNNCAYFNITSGMMGCIGVSEPEPEVQAPAAPEEQPVQASESLREMFKSKLRGILKESDEDEEDTVPDEETSDAVPTEKAPVKSEPKAPAEKPAPEVKAEPTAEPEATPEEPTDEQPEGENMDIWDAIEAGKMGYCMMHKFKASGSRTCDKWKGGGPYKDK